MDDSEHQNSKVCGNLNGDYISNLPDDLKQQIFFKLPMKDVVRTSILSSKWKDSWTSIPSLVFKGKFTESRFIKLVDNVLIVHHGPILKFTLVSKHPCNEAIGRWMLSLSRNGIRNLKLRFGGGERCQIPSRLFSCIALNHVQLSGCIINVPQSFQGFKLLRALSLNKFDLTGISVGNLVSTCPLLEDLSLSHFAQQGCLHIIAANLRNLIICGEFHDLCLETPELTSASIYFYPNNEDYKMLSVANAGNESNIIQALGCLHKIRKLDVGGEFINYLAMGPKPENLPTIFNHLTEIFVPLYSWDQDEIAAALCLFKNAPNLRMLDIEFWDYECEDKPQAQDLWKLKRPEVCLFKCLKEANILHVQNPVLSIESMLQFSELVLSTAPVLQKLNVIDFKDATLFLKKLECFPKLSKEAKIVRVKEW
ncbi:hypothetical protein LUZ61_005034 [Rhynchospora tenuis]|uniref:F-box domain-containing protein n=1 Tax=Rhynchospora tenuis TaxID=198213 RepID=A0AAD5ZNU1_9POAL|nr:hypothetical protein LUZ61_005034 [Rhynchospora tenuis]